MSDMPDGCQLCEGKNPMTWMFTHLSPPATVHSCEHDAVMNLIFLLATIIDCPPLWLYEEITKAVNTAADELEKPDEAPAEAKPRGRRKAAPKPDEDTEEVLADVEEG